MAERTKTLIINSGDNEIEVVTIGLSNMRTYLAWFRPHAPLVIPPERLRSYLRELGRYLAPLSKFSTLASERAGGGFEIHFRKALI